MTFHDPLVPTRREPPAMMAPPERGIEHAGERHDGESFEQTVLRFHRALRGRYGKVIAAGIVCALLLGLAAWRYAPLSYRSEGLIRIAYAMPQVFAESDQNRPMEAFDAFLQSQKLLITSRRIVDLAMQEPSWRSTGRGTANKVIADFAENIEVVTSAKTEYVRIAFKDRDPLIAAAGARSLMAAYARVYNSQDRRSEQQVLTIAEQRRSALSAEVENLDKQIVAMSTEFGSKTIDPLHDSAVQRVAKLQDALGEVKLGLARSPAESAAVPVASDIEILAARDETLRKYMEDLSNLELRLQGLRFRYGANHKLIKDASIEVQLAEERMARRAGQLRALEPLQPAAVAQGHNMIKSRTMLLAEEAEINKLLAEARREMVELGQKRWHLQQLVTLRDANREELVRVIRRIELLEAEGALGGRLSVVGEAEVPLKPARDLRLYAAAAGMAIGGTLPAALVLLSGLYHRRYRYSDEAQATIGHHVPILGILPMLRENSSDQDAVAAQCVHQIRVILHAADVSQESRAYLVTSATAGEGKTSLTLSLGLSFAATGVKTLVIDCDLAGRRLTRGLSEASLPGLPEALVSGHVNGYVQELAGLAILTAGSADGLDANTIGSAALQRLLAAARKSYSVILIDTGPILGSVEAALAAREVDGAILTVARGQEQALVTRAMTQLNSLGTPIAGVVFNRAEPRDFYQSVYVSTYPAHARPNEVRMHCPFGPLVRAVLTSLPRALQMTVK